MVLLHATGASHHWLMDKCYSYISTSILYSMVKGGWLQVSSYNNGKCQEESSEWEQIKLCGFHTGLMDGWIDDWRFSQTYKQIRKQVHFSFFFFLLLFLRYLFVKARRHLKDSQVCWCFFSLLMSTSLSFSLLPSLSLSLFNFASLFDFYTCNLIPHSFSTLLTSDNEVIYHHYVEKASF